MIVKIVQIDKEEVLTTLCKGVEVYRFNVDDNKIASLKEKSIKTITNDMAKDIYVYFILEVSE